MTSSQIRVAVAEAVGTMVPLGAKTKWGKVGGVFSIQGERYYGLVDWHGVVSLMPADVVEKPKDEAEGEVRG